MSSVRIIVFLVTIVPGVVFSQAPHQLFEKANTQYDAGDYETAVTLYQGIIDQGYTSAPIYYNLGNAFYKLGELGEAILYFEKAKLLAPRDADIKHNLDVAFARVQDRVEVPKKSMFIKIYQTLRYFFNLKELAWFTGYFLLAGSLSYLGWKTTRCSVIGSVFGHVFIICVTVFALSAPLLISRTIEAEKRETGIILSEQVSVRSAPQNMSTEVFILHEGTEVRIKDSLSNWYRIQLIDGKEGWISADMVGII